MALATTADYEAITGTTLVNPSAERSRVEALLAMTESAVLAGAHGQNITEATYTAVTLNVSDGYGYFPQRPVSNVASVTCNGDTVAPGGYRWTPGGNRHPALLIRVVDGHDSHWDAGSVLVVTYTAGWNPVPGQVKAIQVGMVVATVANGGQAPASSHSETAGPYSETDSYDTAEARQGNCNLTASDQVILDRLCGLRAPTSIPVVRDQP